MSVRDQQRALFGNPWLAKAIMGVFVCLASAWAGEAPNFITYTHQMEEPGNLEIDTKGGLAKPDGGNRFLGSAMEFGERYINHRKCFTTWPWAGTG